MIGQVHFDSLPLWGLFIVVLLIVLLSIEGGYRLGRYRLNRSAHEVEAPVGAMVGATLGLLAFMLAFTFGAAADRYDSRRQVLLEEANAIGTTWLRADMLPDRGAEIRALLRDYVDIRLKAVQSGQIAAGMRQSEQLHSQLWTHAAALGESNPSSIVVGLFVQSLNEVIDLHTKRITVGGRNRIPGAIWLSLIGVAVLALGAMGYHSGLAATSRSMAQLAVGLAFSMVIGLIADLDRPQEGGLTVSQQALVDLQQSMKASP